MLNHKDLRIDTYQSGPGHAIRITHLPTGIVLKQDFESGSILEHRMMLLRMLEESVITVAARLAQMRMLEESVIKVAARLAQK